MTGSERAVSCVKLNKTFKTEYGSVQALRDASFDVAKGELVMVVGPSGCGKTTLISVIAALLDQDSGSCEVAGQDLSALNSKQKALFRRDRMGFVFQACNLIPTITINQNAAVPLLLAGIGEKTALARSARILDGLGLGDKLHFFPRQLSGGQQQRAAIARAIGHEPALVVCDEPTSALDQATGRHVVEMLRRMVRERGLSLVIVTHDSRIFSYADRIVEMDDGQIIAPRPAPAPETRSILELAS
jgi:putative ABC transport system ATP-binding protein